MTSDDHDVMLQGLRRLAVLESDAARSERVRQRCRVALSRRRAELRATAAPGRLRRSVFEWALVSSLAVVYLFGMIDGVLRVYLRR